MSKLYVLSDVGYNRYVQVPNRVVHNDPDAVSFTELQVKTRKWSRDKSVYQVTGIDTATNTTLQLNLTPEEASTVCRTYGPYEGKPLTWLEDPANSEQSVLAMTEYERESTCIPNYNIPLGWYKFAGFGETHPEGYTDMYLTDWWDREFVYPSVRTARHDIGYNTNWVMLRQLREFILRSAQEFGIEYEGGEITMFHLQEAMENAEAMDPLPDNIIKMRLHYKYAADLYHSVQQTVEDPYGIRDPYPPRIST